MSKIIKQLARNVQKNQQKPPVNPDGFVGQVMTGYDNYERMSRQDGLYFSPSKVSYRKGAGSCPRFWYFKWNNIDTQWKENFSPFSWAAMDSGTDSHLRMGVLFEASDLDVVDVERKLKVSDPPIQGSIDFVVSRMGEEILVEFKTTRSEAFDARKRKGNAMGYHVMQVCLYMYMNGTENAIVLYENRNDFELYAVPISLEENRENMNATLGWMKEVWDAFEKGLMPANVFTWNAPLACAECPFKVECFEKPAAGDIKIERAPDLDWK